MNNSQSNLPAGGTTGFVMVVVLLILALGASAWVGLGITTRDRWPIQWLEVQGSFERVSAEQLRASLLPLTKSNFFTLDLNKLQDAAQRIPWVAEVKVQKRWPDTVVVTVVEYRPVAHWNSEQLVSEHGQIFAVPEASDLQGLPWLEGRDQRFDEILQRWTEYNTALTVHGLEIQRLVQDKRGSWKMTLSNNTDILIGRHATRIRLDRFLKSWPVLLNGREMPPQSVDLRYTNGVAVNWQQPGDAESDLTESTGN